MLRWLFVSLLTLSCYGQTSATITMTGVLYANDSGISGGGSGVIHLRTSAGVHLLAYEKPLNTRFSDDSCWTIGAVWTVDVRRGTSVRGGQYPAIVRAHCDANFDAGIRSAVLTTHRALSAAIAGDFQRMRTLLTLAAQRRWSIDDLSEMLGGLQDGLGRLTAERLPVVVAEQQQVRLSTEQCFLRRRQALVIVQILIRRDDQEWLVDDIEIDVKQGWN